MARDESGIPNNLRKVYRRFERWRSSHTGRIGVINCDTAAFLRTYQVFLNGLPASARFCVTIRVHSVFRSCS